MLQAAAHHFHSSGRWNLRLLLAMPDHVHLIASFSAAESVVRVVSDWKRYTARAGAIDWQRNFFDHRLRPHDNLDEKAAYIRMNPVRAGLIARAVEWPHVYRPDCIATPE